MPAKSRHGKWKNQGGKKARARQQTGTPASQPAVAAAAAQPSVAAAAPPPAPARPPSPAKAAASKVLEYPSITGELRLIGILVGIIVVVLIILSFVLR